MLLRSLWKCAHGHSSGFIASSTKPPHEAYFAILGRVWRLLSPFGVGAAHKSSFHVNPWTAQTLCSNGEAPVVDHFTRDRGWLEHSRTRGDCFGLNMIPFPPPNLFAVIRRR